MASGGGPGAGRGMGGGPARRPARHATGGGRVAGRPAAADIAGEFGAEGGAAWRAGAVRERDAEGAEALLAVPLDTPLAGPDSELAGLLPAALRVARAVTVLAGDRPGSIAD